MGVARWGEVKGRRLGISHQSPQIHVSGTFALFPSHWFPQKHQQPPETSLVVGQRTVLLQSSRQTPVLVAQLCPTLDDPMHCILPSSLVHEILQARILEWVATPFSRESSQPRDQTWVSRIAGRFFYHLSHKESHRWTPEMLLNIQQPPGHPAQHPRKLPHPNANRAGVSRFNPGTTQKPWSLLL